MTTANLCLIATAGAAAVPPDPSWLSPLVQIPIGAVLAWFMFRAERKMEEQNRIQRAQVSATERATYAQMVALMGLRHMDLNIVQLAKIIAEQAQKAEQENDAHANPSS